MFVYNFRFVLKLLIDVMTRFSSNTSLFLFKFTKCWCYKYFDSTKGMDWMQKLIPLCLLKHTDDVYIFDCPSSMHVPSDPQMK